MNARMQFLVEKEIKPSLGCMYLQWQKQAQDGRKGLWASSRPQEPWEYRKAKRNGTA